MADNNVEDHSIAVLLMQCLYEGDVIEAKRLLVVIDEPEKKMIVSKIAEPNSLLYDAATCGHAAMVELLVNDFRAGVEGDYPVSPLWYAASEGRFEVVKLLQELGADINAVSETKMTSVNHACRAEKIETVKFLVRQGADINRPDEQGETCLMNSVSYLELCQFLIDNGARVYAQDNLGNTALHHAIEKSKLEIVQLLLDHGSDQNIQNNLGDDALQLASFHGKESIVNELVARQKPSLSRWIQSQQLLGSYCLLYLEDVIRALFHWRRAVKLRMTYPCTDLRNTEPSSVYLVGREVNTVDELGELCQDGEMAYIYALESQLRIVNPGHKETTDVFVSVSMALAKAGNYTRFIDLMKYAFKYQSDSPWTKENNNLMDTFIFECWKAVNRSSFKVEFQDVFEILDIVSSNVIFARQMNECDRSSFVEHILSFVRLVIRLEQNRDLMDSFKKVVYRLVHSDMVLENGWTFLHRAVEQCCCNQGYLSVVEVLLECGADVNAVDCSNNTALHLCAQPYPGIVTLNEREEVIKLLFRYSTHVDIVNDSGDIAAKGLQLHILDHVNLQCLAATIIQDHWIAYEGEIPAHLESFVQMHGRCGSWLH